MANMQKQPLRCVINFKELSAVTLTLARSLEKHCEGVPIHSKVGDFKFAGSKMYFFLTIFKVFVKCFRVLTPKIAS